MSRYLSTGSTTVIFQRDAYFDVRQRIYDDQRENIEQDMAPFGFIDDGLGDEYFADAQGDVVAEYGDNSYVGLQVFSKI